jgi:isopenicillin-N epimerase
MSINRRSFLQKSAVTASLWTLGNSRIDAQTKAVPALEMPWDQVREEFELDPSVIHMAGLLLASHPRTVREAIGKYREALDRNPPGALSEYWMREEASREAAARYLETDVGEIALTDSTTMGLGLLYGGMRIRKDQEILSTLHDHSSTNTALDYKAAVCGCSVKRIALFEISAEPDREEIVKRLHDAITEKTRVVAVTFVHSASGVKLPLAAIGEMIEKVNGGRTPENRILFSVDGVHGLGVENFKVRDLSCDFYVSGCHKWLFGPRGTGIVWGRKESWDQVAPIIPTFSGRNSPGRLMTPGGFHSFEHRWALAEAFEFHLTIGKQRVQERIHDLNTRLKLELASIKGLTLHTPKSPAFSAGIVCFELAGMTPRDVVERLREKNIVASATPYAVSYARFTPGVLNRVSDLERTVAAVKSIAV